MLMRLFNTCSTHDILLLLRNNPPEEVMQSQKKYFLHARTAYNWGERNDVTIYKAYGDDLDELVEEASTEVHMFLMENKK